MKYHGERKKLIGGVGFRLWARNLRQKRLGRVQKKKGSKLKRQKADIPKRHRKRKKEKGGTELRKELDKKGGYSTVLCVWAETSTVKWGQEKTVGGWGVGVYLHDEKLAEEKKQVTGHHPIP